ncbi:MAG: DNA double-strand break repair nuclease NurA [Candidatus Thermoplasmatota archaeon]
MAAFGPAVDALTRHAGQTLTWRPAFHPLVEAPTADPGVIAVDGSNAVLADNGAVWVVAHRATALAWPGPAAPIDAVITAATPADAARMIGRPVAGADAFGAALRERAEARALRDAIAAAPAGLLVLADGALRGLPPDAQGEMDAARRLAADRSVTLVGVSKRSGLERDGVALVPALHAAGPPGRWAAAVGEGVWVARLHAAAPCAFRIDADDVADVARLVDLARDAAYVGYPYPLAKAHNQVAFTAGAVAELKGGLERALRKSGGAALAAVADFHDTLDRNVVG